MSSKQALDFPIDPEISYQLVTHQSTSSVKSESAFSPSTYRAATSERISRTSDSVVSVEPMFSSFCFFIAFFFDLVISSLAILSSVSSRIV